MTSSRYGKALVLGPGGLVGTAWLVGLAAGLRHRNVELADADLIVGTSAGAIAAALLTTGRNLDELETLPPSRADLPPFPLDPGVMAEVFEALSDPTLDRTEARRRAGRIALTATAPPETHHLTQMSGLIGATAWPDRPLLVTAVDAESGEPEVWDRDGAATLVEAVASSSAAPGAVTPITVGGRRYMDGGLWNGANIHLAASAETRIFIEPFAARFPAGDLSGLRIAPNAESEAAFGSDPGDRAAWTPSYRAGARQAAEVAELLPF